MHFCDFNATRGDCRLVLLLLRILPFAALPPAPSLPCPSPPLRDACQRHRSEFAGRSDMDLARRLSAGV
eukprot:9470292-Pyramimonas_sp.AAC.1